MSAFKKILFVTLILSSVPLIAGNFSLLPDTLQAAAKHRPDKWLAPDKALHVAGSMIVMTALSVNLHRRAGFSRKKALGSGFAFTFSLGIAKEIWDGSKTDNYFSYKDLSANIIGACIGAFLACQD